MKGVVLALAATAATALPVAAEWKPLELGGFEVRHATTVPGTPEAAFDAFTGDILPWWDHHFAEKPKALYIEPKPGGGFFEIFDDEGNGVRHAVVIYAHRGKLLRLDGPLGLSGNAIDFVSSIEFEPAGDSTRVTVVARSTGQTDPAWAPAVDGVWRHFLVARFKAYVEGRLR